MGGTTITITGNGFAPMGVMNRITFTNSELSLQIPCVPKILKNYECQLTSSDPRLECGPDHGFRDISYYKESIHDRGYASWYEFSTSLIIECDIGTIDLEALNHRDFHDKIIYERNAILDLAEFDLLVETVAPETVIDEVSLLQDFYDIRLSLWCPGLAGCEINSRKGFFATGVFFGDWFNFADGESIVNSEKDYSSNCRHLV